MEVGKAKNPRSWMLRFHTQTAGCSLTAQQPENNIVRTAFQALAGVLGGTQSLHTNSMDESLALPTEKSVKIALRTQQLIAFESGVVNTIDPLAGSYFVESLTAKMEQQSEEYFERIDAMGGVIAGIEQGFFQKEIADAAYRYQREVESKDKIIVGVNEFVEDDGEITIPLLKIDPNVEKEQKRRLSELRQSRDTPSVRRALENLKRAAVDGPNLIPHLLEAAHASVTLGEMCSALIEPFGIYHENTVF